MIFSSHLSLFFSRTKPESEKDGSKATKFSRLLGLISNEDVDAAANNGRGSRDARDYEIEAFKNTPIFSSAAHELVESRISSSSEVAGDVDQASTAELMPQYGLLGALQHEPVTGGISDLKERLSRLQADEREYQAQVDPVDRLVLANMNVPWSSFICGSQGSGKSHTLSCLLENALVSGGPEDSPAAPGNLPAPLAAIQFHYDSFTSEETTQLCEAAYLCSNGKTPVTILVSPSNIWAMKRLYSNLPGLPPDAPRPRVLPLYLSEDQLNIGRMLKLMAVNPNKNAASGGSNAGPLYIEIVRSMVREVSWIQVPPPPPRLPGPDVAHDRVTVDGYGRPWVHLHPLPEEAQQAEVGEGTGGPAQYAPEVAGQFHGAIGHLDPLDPACRQRRGHMGL